MRGPWRWGLHNGNKITCHCLSITCDVAADVVANADLGFTRHSHRCSRFTASSTNGYRCRMFENQGHAVTLLCMHICKCVGECSIYVNNRMCSSVCVFRGTDIHTYVNSNSSPPFQAIQTSLIRKTQHSEMPPNYNI